MSFLSFKLADGFVADYEQKPVKWGFPIGNGNSLGEITFLTKYSRLKEDGSKEKWVETCRRCIEGMYSILKDHCKEHRTPWNELKAQKSAQEAFDRMFTFKWTPPGRGLWMMGTEVVHTQKNSASLQNCSFLSTKNISNRSVHEATMPFTRMMEMSMLGIGVGFDTEGAGKLIIHHPKDNPTVFQVPDSREGWVESLRLILETFFFEGRNRIEFDYSLLRPKGSPLKTFGGIAGGPEILEDLHIRLNKILGFREGEALTSTDIVDIMNLIGYCVVAGNTRRSAQIVFGDASDEEYINLKNWEVNPERMGPNGWGGLSNNSVFAEVGMDYDNLVPNIVMNGEPGLFYRKLAQDFGRMIDPPNFKDYRVAGGNPCLEQSLEHNELCVSGDTKLHTREGIFAIKEIVDQSVEIWNGTQWASVTPFQTGLNDLYRVTFSDGSYLDATPKHEWIAKTPRSRSFGVFTTDQLEVGMHLPEFNLINSDGKYVERAYEWGWFAGDGFIDGNRALALVQESESKILNSLITDAVYPMQNNHQSTSQFCRVNLSSSIGLNLAKHLRNHEDGLPAEVMMMDQESIAEFVGGWIDTDGSLMKNPNTDHYVLYGSESKLRDLQILLRRIGVNHASLRIFAAKGSVTNKGTRKYDIYRLLIPSYEAVAIHTRLKVATRFGSRMRVNNAHLNSQTQIDAARKQKVVSIEKIGENLPTYCFNEPISHMGVFGNVLTRQCTLVETYMPHHDSYEDFERTMKFAYLYGKAVTLMPTHWPDSNEVMQRNRRIGCSISGVAQFVESHGWNDLKDWMDRGYNAVQQRDRQYSEWLGIRESIKTTSIKPSGTVSLLAGVTPGVHWPVADTYIRRMRLAANDPILEKLRDAGYVVEPDVMDTKNTMVVELPTRGPKVRTEREVSVWEKVNLAIAAQRYWADNQVSVTLTFLPEEINQIGPMLNATEGQLKGLSLLPLGEVGAYAQMPYERINDEVYKERIDGIKPIDFNALYAGEAREAEGERFCNNDNCVIQ